jgi:hypothetical protein
MDKKEKSKGAIVVVVARHTRSPKTRELTESWSDENWQILCEKLRKEKIGESHLPHEPLFILPDFEPMQSDTKEAIHKTIRMLFKVRNQHAAGSPIAVLSCFEHGSEIDKLLKRSFQIFLSVNGDQGNSFMIYTQELEKIGGKKE